MANAMQIGVLNPDSELTQETLDLIEKLRTLPSGQVDALLLRAVPRYLYTEFGIEEDQKPKQDEILAGTGTIFNFWGDIVGMNP